MNVVVIGGIEIYFLCSSKNMLEWLFSWNGCFLGYFLLFFRGAGWLAIDFNDMKGKKKPCNTALREKYVYMLVT